MQQILQVLDNATPENKIKGRDWYKKANNYCVYISKQFKVDLPIVVGILSALSPLKEWGLNKRLLQFYLQGQRNVHTKSQVFKCDLILQGKDIETCLGGMKTINFYRNILDPTDNEPVTIDRHILKLYPEIKSLTPKRYNNIKEDFHQAATNKGTISNRCQAICWLEIKKK